MERDTFMRMVATAIEENPDWAGDTVSAAMAGADRARIVMQETINRKHMALMAALVLVESGRITAETKAAMNDVVKKGMEEDK